MRYDEQDCQVPAVLTGANLEIDVSIQYLRFFMKDDAELADIEQRYQRGEMLTGEVKARLIEVIPSTSHKCISRERQCSWLVLLTPVQQNHGLVAITEAEL